MQTRVLIVEDDEALARVISDNLRFEGYEVEATGDGNDAITRLRAFQPDIVLLDIMLPNRNGLDLCAVIRQGGRVPVIILSARGQKADKIKGLQLGADDYLAKPFAYLELVARIRALGRRGGTGGRGQILECEGVRLDPDRRIAERDGRPIRLTPKEMGVLEVLLQADGGVVTTSELLDEVWEDPLDRSRSIVKVVIFALRRKLGLPPVIHTDAGFGYRIGGIR